MTIFESRLIPEPPGHGGGASVQDACQSPGLRNSDDLLFNVQDQHDEESSEESYESDDEEYPPEECPPEECPGDHEWDAGDDLNPDGLARLGQESDDGSADECDGDGPEEADMVRDDGCMLQERTDNFEDGSSYVGQFRGSERHGWGKFTWKSGGGYEGQFVRNDMHGEGTYDWQDGSSYTGLWQVNTMGPDGTMRWTDGRKYTGQFKNGLKHGEGKLSWPDGRSYTGQWQAGKQHGVGSTITASGVPRQSRWEHGKMVQWLDDAQLSPTRAGGKSLSPPSAH